MQKTFTPEFSSLMRQYEATAAGLGRDHALAERLWLLCMATAPSWFLDEMHQVARDMGLMPTPCGYSDDGTAHFTLNDLAERLGVTLAEAEAHLLELESAARAAGVSVNFRQVDPGKLHPIQ